MGDKFRGAIAILFSLVGLVESYILFQKHVRDWHFVLVITASLLLIVLGIWRLRRKSEQDERLY
jgi:uncharacterized membrane protein